MIKRHTHEALTWIDMYNPTSEEIRKVMDEYHIPPELMSDLTAPIPRSEIKVAQDAAKITLDFPIVKDTPSNKPQEIKFIVTNEALITVRFEEINSIYKFSKEFEVLSTLSRTGKNTHGGHLFIALFGTLYDELSSKLDYLDSKMLDIEREIADEREKAMVIEISQVGRRLITFRQILAAHEEVLSDAVLLLSELFGKTFTKQFEDIHTHFQHIVRRLGALTETLEELRDTNTALLTTKQNEIMKTLTIMAFITFPLTLLTSMFGMNTETTPIVGNKGDFWIILGIMSVATVGFFIFFKHKRWM